MLGQRSVRIELLVTFVAFYLHFATGVHSFMPAQVGKLRVRLREQSLLVSVMNKVIREIILIDIFLHTYFETNFAFERFHTRMYMRVLFQTGRCGERFTACLARVRPRSVVVRSDMPLQITRLAERFIAIFARKKLVTSMR